MLALSASHPRLAAFLLLACLTSFAAATECKIVHAHAPTDAEQAYLHDDYDRAATLYQQQLQQKPDDPIPAIGLAQTLLKQQKIKAADSAIQSSLLHNPKSAPLLIALAEIQYREGTPWIAAATIDVATPLDPCYARMHLLSARILRLSSFYGSAAKQLSMAHALDPTDPEIQFLWIQSLPFARRIAELKSYLAIATGADPEELAHLHLYLSYLQKEADEQHKTCHLVSHAATTSINFAPMMQDATHVKAFGLDARFNDHNARLEIDTGATGLLVSRSVAERSGLKRFADSKVGGIGSEGEKSSYSAYADDIKIGDLEFRDCQVEVLDKRSVLDTDGLIGMDVFANFLVTLDYPMRKLVLGQLPQRPDESARQTPTLLTSNSSSSSSDEAISSTDSPQAAATPAKPTFHGPLDRYIAPEMKDWTHVYRVGHDLLIRASLNNSSEKLFILDTGAFTTSISPEAAREVTKVHLNGDMSVHGISGKVDKIYSADNITFRFGNLAQKIQDVVAFDTSHLSNDIGLDISGLIGITALGQTTMSIDYRDGLVKFVYDAHRGYAYPGFQ